MFWYLFLLKLSNYVVCDIRTSVKDGSLIHHHSDLLCICYRPYCKVYIFEDRLHEFSFFVGSFCSFVLEDLGFLFVVGLFFYGRLGLFLLLVRYITDLFLYLLEFGMLEHYLLRIYAAHYILSKCRTCYK